MIRPLSIFFVFIMGMSSLLFSDWKMDVCVYFTDTKDYKGAIEYLTNSLGKIDEGDMPVVWGLLAYSFSKLQRKTEEYAWIEKYFETYWGRRERCDFLDASTNAEIMDYLTLWKNRYPLVIDISLVKGKIYDLPSPPARIAVGVEITNEAYYKLSDDHKVLMGGLFKKGFNIIHIDALNLFERSGSHRYFFNLKAGDLILKKEVNIVIQLKSQEVMKKPAVKREDGEYKISMFVGDELIMSSKKAPLRRPSLKLDLPPAHGKFSPFGPVPLDKSDPSLYSTSIFSVLGLAYQTLNKLLKKEDKTQPYIIQKQKRIDTQFKRRDSQGIEREIEVIIMLRWGTSLNSG